MHGNMNSCGSVHGGGVHDNSTGMHVNSCGALGHRNSCNLHAAGVRGGTMAPSMSTRLGVRCLAVEKLGDYKLHGELDVAGDSVRLRRAGGRRTFSSSLLVKRYSSSTLSRSQLHVAGDSARVRRAGGRRTFSSSMSVKRCSSSTLSRSQARCCPSACAARAEAGGSHDSFESSFCSLCGSRHTFSSCHFCHAS